jgi:hypothetical protein
MTKENLKRLYKHYTYLTEGKFGERDFDKDIGKGGIIQLGKLTQNRKLLIISDAKKALADLVKKYPEIKEEVEKETKPQEKPNKSNSKKTGGK